ncbi:hypothetical protein MPLSOD_150096 [Mesorhizobium sp. SOD10]|nr:hypothetical protein MPLSOD_150096 [Mesorhizobium sp. SOD10]
MTRIADDGSSAGFGAFYTPVHRDYVLIAFDANSILNPRWYLNRSVLPAELFETETEHPFTRNLDANALRGFAIRPVQGEIEVRGFRARIDHHKCLV